MQAVTPLGDFTPQEFFDALIETYERKYDIISTDSAVSAHTSPDNVDCWFGNIKMLVNSTFFDIDVLIAPQKNTVASFAATCYKDNQDIVDIREVSSTAPSPTISLPMTMTATVSRAHMRSITDSPPLTKSLS